MTVDAGLVRLVNAVLWPGFSGTTVPSWLGHALDTGLAGVVYFGQNIDQTDAAQPARLSGALRGIRSDVLIGSDEEGGNVTRLDASRGSPHAGHAQLGFVDDVAATRWVGRSLGADAVAAGVNVVLGPVADVTTQLANPVIGVRSFGSDPALVSRHVAAMIDGVQSVGVAACVKHFPGHGDTHTDSHLALPRLDLSWAEIERVHLPPFLAAIEAGVRAVMTAHIVVPELGPAPATLNARVLGALRSHGFTGTIVTDALDMAAIRETVGAGPGAVQALLAGAELLCIGNPANVAGRVDVDDFLEVQGALLAAVADGVLGVDVLERAGASVARLAGSGSVAAASVDAASFESVPLVRAGITVHGTVALPQGDLTILDVRSRPTMAVSSQLDAFSDELARSFTVDRLLIGPAASAAGSAAEAVAVEHGIVVLADRMATAGDQRAAVQAIVNVRSTAVVINAGLTAPMPGPWAEIDARGASRVTARVVRALVSGVSA
ncbi:glycoside hydrolase family 3 N-terminal domain-containing protein [Cryobacterium sp. PH29-G1]|uniref:glycoside hydrolase family 3 N-terminal domain-containing protein n=1 Tax=Cryobacterium sp. PH29-G1 TaxID=3046211 RepID=UPI0024BA93B7|nr:glycoside hydrolase family 3 N-terminal domain-containing protein [Cryobacterium sp. PH29-G1]MDJ0350637.1 glycoside hydrolase family 3 N-terminal domain-containing protein [Cryobacterium sp. PH29-G1]